MKRQTIVKVQTADEIIENSAAFIAREAAQSACCIPMRDHEYWALVGADFMTYFSKHQIGTGERYQWETRHVDQLCNLWIWRI